MKEIKILIVENEVGYIETAFEYMNDLYYDNRLDFKIIAKSQDLPSNQNLENYDIIFLDISLAKSSELDGIGILRKINSDNILIKKLVILTGNHNIQEKLKENGLGVYPIVTKPIDFNDLLKVIG
ncbi:hypothetical protein GCM10007103_03480 [Salinimicrobium marinum]|uniref:Response regulatory domain-containing protein n=1 Tax=Salinimicrobium marinum TaxID=680283 RepID=A0A918VUJ8_9FLAO|nr:response regulator [Salinimicrobium marinum]GHA25552.1 hypothetical protein GCM10007103_03480 [Salinimicrobium marinum]